ncbi:hypothetical protein KSP39_PZI010736 [Platanthera zijinensis]|uniref:Uncharacterized protein n=1 Tax=Platanthera zijinensis TaxID=2320716 RepID=A0AAP0G6M8_9ASPA
MEKKVEALLCDTAVVGDCERLRELLAAGADPSLDFDGMPPIMHAAAGGHANAVSCLLNAGAPWNALSPSNLSARDFSMLNDHQEALDVLLIFAIQAELVLGTLACGGGGHGSASNEGYLVAMDLPLYGGDDREGRRKDIKKIEPMR